MERMLIIGPAIWNTALQKLAAYKTDTSIPTEVVTIEWIEANVQGVDAPERIKRTIESQHRLNGVDLVLLAGDINHFPVRFVRARNTEWGDKYYPSDLYYADLYDASGAFEDWDATGDGIYAEMDFSGGSSTEKFNIDKINIRPDVSVGRVPASDLAEFQRYVSKVISYECAASESYWYDSPTDWVKRALFVVDGGPSPFGDEAQSDQQAVPLTQIGFDVLKRYQDTAPWNTASKQQRAAEISRVLNEGVGFLHYNGHGTHTDFENWYDTADVAALNNAARLPIVIALACYTARFNTDRDSYLTLLGGNWTGSSTPKPSRPQPAPLQPAAHDLDSLAEEFLVKHEAGAIAYLGAVSKYEQGGKALGRYLIEAYRNQSKPPVLGTLWREAMTRFVQNELSGGTVGMGPYYAFIHVHKVMLFGDPSLRVGGLPYPEPLTLVRDMTPTTMAHALGL